MLLICTFRVLHGLALQLYLQLGMKITSVKQVISFQQGDYMKLWVQFCTQMRATSTNSFAKKFWKLVRNSEYVLKLFWCNQIMNTSFLLQMVNSVYGKTIENLSKRDSVKICRTKEELLREVSKSTYKRQIIVNEEMVIVTHRKTQYKKLH